MSHTTGTRHRFNLGQIVATKGALHALEESGAMPHPYLSRHVRGDWGDVCADDAQLNDEAVKEGTRLFSAYFLPNEVKIWIITDAADIDGRRPSTTVLLPDDY